jgi:hypothetical protein
VFPLAENEPGKGSCRSGTILGVVRVTDDTHPILSFQSFGKSCEADIARLRPVYLRAFKRGRPIICLSDARLATHSVDQRKLWADWLAETNREDTHGCSVATVILLDSVLLRSALIALNWITPARVPQHVVGNLDEALDECRNLAERHRMAIPAATYGQIRLWIEAGRSAQPADARAAAVR